MAKKKGLKISVGHRDTYFRAGLQITKEGIEVAEDSLTKHQLKALKEDTNLRVTEISIGADDVDVDTDKDPNKKP